MIAQAATTQTVSATTDVVEDLQVSTGILGGPRPKTKRVIILQSS